MHSSTLFHALKLASAHSCTHSYLLSRAFGKIPGIGTLLYVTIHYRTVAPVHGELPAVDAKHIQLHVVKLSLSRCSIVTINAVVAIPKPTVKAVCRSLPKDMCNQLLPAAAAAGGAHMAALICALLMTHCHHCGTVLGQPFQPQLHHGAAGQLQGCTAASTGTT